LGSDPTAAGGGEREGSEWLRSARDEGVRAEDIRRVTATGEQHNNRDLWVSVFFFLSAPDLKIFNATGEQLQ